MILGEIIQTKTLQFFTATVLTYFAIYYLFIYLFRMGLLLRLSTKSCVATMQTNPLGEHFFLVLFVFQYFAKLAFRFSFFWPTLRIISSVTKPSCNVPCVLKRLATAQRFSFTSLRVICHWYAVSTRMNHESTGSTHHHKMACEKQERD